MIELYKYFQLKHHLIKLFFSSSVRNTHSLIAASRIAAAAWNLAFATREFSGKTSIICVNGVQLSFWVLRMNIIHSKNYIQNGGVKRNPTLPWHHINAQHINVRPPSQWLNYGGEYSEQYNMEGELSHQGCVCPGPHVAKAAKWACCTWERVWTVKRIPTLPGYKSNCSI